MPKRITSFVPAVSATFLAAVIALSVNIPARAGGECIERPTQQPTEGAHWYYRLDRAKNRKCWYLASPASGVARGSRTPEAGTPQEQSGSIPTPTFSSMFSSLFGGLTAGTTTAAPQDTTMREPRIIQANPTRMLKVDDIVQKGQPNIPEERPERRYAQPVKPAQRDALFQKFLQWNDQHNMRGADPQ